MRARQRLVPRCLAPALLTVLVAGCDASREPVSAPEPSRPTAPLIELPGGRPPTEPRQALALVPRSATTVTITDWDAIRRANGYPNLTGEDLMTDRTAFWEAARRSSVLLTDGLLREDNSLFLLDYGFTQDDVDFEVRFTGPGGRGYVLGFRPDLDLERVRRAVADGAGPLKRAEVLAGPRLLVSGTAEEGEPVWASEPRILELTAGTDESTYLHDGCVPFNDALGVDATDEHQEALLADYDVANLLRPLEAFSLSFDGGVATGRLGLGRTDLAARTDLTEDWPTTGTLAFTDGFEGLPLFDGSTGRVGLRVRNPVAAATLTLTNLLPFAVCNEVEPLEVPTGP